MTCTCKEFNRNRTDTHFVEAIRSGIETFRNLPSAFAIARNGGCEQTLRNLMLDPLEKSLNCIAFTEAGGTRIDILLVCLKCEKPWAILEIKSNFSCQSELAKRKGQARDQLVSYREKLRPVHSFYLQLAIDLDIKPSAENSTVANLDAMSEYTTSYKSFRSSEKIRENARGRLEDLSSTLTSFHPIFELKQGDAVARVHCWVGRLEIADAAPQLVPLDID